MKITRRSDSGKGGHLLIAVPAQQVAEIEAALAALDARQREHRQAAAAAARRAERAAVDRAVDEVSALIRSLLQAVLLTNGFHQHQRQWRRHRGSGK